MYNFKQLLLHVIIYIMSKVNLLLTTANGNLSNSKTTIKEAIEKAEKYAFPKLGIDWEVDVVVTDKIPMTIPENGAGGYTYSADLIRIIIDEKTATKDIIAESAVHEFCHAARWGKNSEWVKTLFDALIFEGIAVTFEAQFTKELKEKQLFIKTILKRTDKENEKILAEIQDQLDTNSYDYNTIFFKGNNKLPQWSGYSVGYYLVKKYLEKTNKKIEDVFANKYADFKSVL